MPTDAFEMALAHAPFRNELHNAVGLIRGVSAGNTKRSAIVGGHVNFIATALYHHHAAEDEVIWPKLHARAPTRELDIARMEGAHREIERDVARVRDSARSWAISAEPRIAEQLVAALGQLSVKLDEHLADEERNIVPLINAHLTPKEWRKFLARGAQFLWVHPKLGLVLAGFVLNPVSADERRRFLSNVPAPQRMAFQLLGMRTFAAYRAKLYGSPASS